ncbi:hypothetical protein [Paenibacillus sp.]|uniref:hypothetical protein n=1 Tax=Paenibacillus sp. TaxID=58172 RepID=UPI002D4FA65E|nr:hypothetical protein [Paenibacillus sp.]HZG84764.1 hypothetical protein [Paenibacillus sp.]
MILPFHNFNVNDWFILGCIVVGYFIVYRLRRTFPTSLTLLIMLFSLSLAKAADHTLGIKPLDWYDTNEIPVFDVADLLTWFIYPVAGFIFVHSYHRLRVQGLEIPAYILASSLIAAAFELLCVQVRIFTYKEWNLGYSFVIYLAAQTLTLAFYHKTKQWFLRGKRRRILSTT